MNKLVGLLLVLVTLTGCSLLLDIKDIRDPSVSFTSLTDMHRWMDKNLYYSIADGGRYWAAPQETIERGWAHCTGFAVFVMYFAHRDLGMETGVVGIKTPYGNHALVSLNGVWYDAEGMFVWDMRGCSVIDTWSYKEALMMCLGSGSRSIDEINFDF